MVKKMVFYLKKKKEYIIITEQMFVQQSIDIVIRLYIDMEVYDLKKSISISIRVSEEDLEKFKQAARYEAYASYSEFVRRTALIEASKIIKNNEEGDNIDECN